jgi:hypothetical protein
MNEAFRLPDALETPDIDVVEEPWQPRRYLARSKAERKPS